MCGRYTLTQPEKLKKRFKTVNDIKKIEPSYNIAPAQYLPTITRNSPNKITMMKWGFVPHWGKDKKLSLINIRSETVKEKPYFKNILFKDRCLIPSDGFFEWKKIKLDEKEEKIPYYIRFKDHKIFSFAGIYIILKDAEGKEIFTFAILTTKPNSLVAKIHNRMPVILQEENEDLWLNSSASLNDLLKVLKPYSAKPMTAHKISKKVNSPRNDYPSILERA
ncbi:SOS response-associated peptidase [Candidatus Woesebacteria bacterium]|nr:SOS response-associated peptidase [Candidatus Woesebacteria bacterium]